MNPHIFWPKDAAFVANVYIPMPGIIAADAVAAFEATLTTVHSTSEKHLAATVARLSAKWAA